MADGKGKQMDDGRRVEQLRDAYKEVRNNFKVYLNIAVVAKIKPI